MLYYIRIISSLFIFLLLSVFSFSQETKPTLDSLKKDAINIFIDCNMCDADYFRKEITFVNYVRDRKEAQVHILASFQSTASGGGPIPFSSSGRRTLRE